MLGFIPAVGRWGIRFVTDIGDAGVFMVKALFSVPKRPVRGVMDIFHQLYFVGVLSLLIILLSGLFIGMVVSLQGYNTLHKFGAEMQLGPLVALSVVRELAPVVAALLFAGRAGSSLAAEIGLMRATNQLAAMDMMAVNPLTRVVAPRFWAGIISLPLLTVLFMVIAIWGGKFVAVDWLGVDVGSFWGNMQSAVNFSSDVLNGIWKSVVFGVVITWVAVYQGFTAEPNARGVSSATTNTVVYGSLLVLGLDFVLTALMMGGW